jgi:hypothetical protein
VQKKPIITLKAIEFIVLIALKTGLASRDIELMEEGVRLAMLKQASTKHGQAGRKRRKKKRGEYTICAL